MSRDFPTNPDWKKVKFVKVHGSEFSWEVVLLNEDQTIELGHSVVFSTKIAAQVCAINVAVYYNLDFI